MNYLIVGLGNIGDEYKDTRHNIGFMVLDTFAKVSNTSFNDSRYGSVATTKHKGRTFILLKPSTYMNLSGNAIRYWLNKEKIPLERLLVIVDDIALPFGSYRMRPKGNDGGHNGLAHINSVLGTNSYPRIRIGIGDSFKQGGQVNYVLSNLLSEEEELFKAQIPVLIDMIRSFGTIGLELTMTTYNKFGKPKSSENIEDKRSEP